LGGRLEFTFTLEPIPADTGGAYRKAAVDVVIDSRVSREEQLHSAFYEVLSAYLDPHEDRRDFFLDVADTLVEACRVVDAP